MRKEKYILLLVHGDDDCSTGSATSLSWLDAVLSKRYEINALRVGMGEGCTREGWTLNRVVGATVETEADQRHAELIIEQLQLQGRA